MRLTVSYGDDFASTTNFSPYNAYQYGLDQTSAKGVEDMVKEWFANATRVTELNRAIPIPYFVSSMDMYTREETAVRFGTLQNSYASQLTEKAFWMYLIPKIIDTYYSDYNLSDEDVNGEIWTKINNLIRDLYTQMKATFADSILDDNNNIVNFSMDNELPVVRLKITYKYGV